MHRLPFNEIRIHVGFALRGWSIQLAIDNEAVLALGIGGLGEVAQNHHVGPMHPEYAELPPIKDLEMALEQDQKDPNALHQLALHHVLRENNAEAMDLHMEGASDRSRAAMEFLEPIGFELYGQPTERFKAAMGDMSSLLQIHPTHKAGFDRL